MFIDGNLSNLTPAQQDVVLAKPYWRMCAFASMLNWRGLRLTWIQFTDEDAAAWPTVPESKILVSYVTTDQEFHLQINELPDQPGLHNATAGPFRYGIPQSAIGCIASSYPAATLISPPRCDGSSHFWTGSNFATLPVELHGRGAP